MAFLLEIALIAFVIYLVNKYFHNYWTRNGFPQHKPTFLVGNIGKLLAQRASVPVLFDEIYQKYKNDKFIGIYLFYRPSLFVMDTELINRIIVQDFGSFHDHTVPVDEEKDPLTGQLFALKGQKWRNLRIKLSPAFTSGKLKMMFPIIRSCVDVLTEYIDKNIKNGQSVFSSKDLFLRSNTNVISSIAFGIDNDCINDPNNEFYINGKNFFVPTLRNSIRQLVFMFIPSLASPLNIKFAPKDVDTFFRNSVKEIVDYREKTNYRRNDFMDLLLQLKNQGFLPADNELEEGEKQVEYDEKTKLIKLNLNEVAAQAFVFFLGSFETLSSTINFLLIELARNKNIQKKVQEEIDQVFSTQGVSYDSVKNLKYLECCLNESLRKYPAVPLITRECTKDYKIPGTDLIITKGTDISLPVFSIQHDPEIFDKPSEFIPERFLDSPTGNSAANGLCYFPFGDGPRHCIGMRMAKVNVKTTISALLSKFTVDLVDEKHIKKELEFDRKMFPLTPADDIKIRITPR